MSNLQIQNQEHVKNSSPRPLFKFILIAPFVILLFYLVFHLFSLSTILICVILLMLVWFTPYLSLHNRKLQFDIESQILETLYYSKEYLSGYQLREKLRKMNSFKLPHDTFNHAVKTLLREGLIQTKPGKYCPNNAESSELFVANYSLYSRTLIYSRQVKTILETIKDFGYIFFDSIIE